MPPELVNQLCDHFQTDNASEAIRKGIHEFLTKSSYSKRMDDFALHQIILTVEERTTIKNIPSVSQMIWTRLSKLMQPMIQALTPLR